MRGKRLNLTMLHFAPAESCFFQKTPASVLRWSIPLPVVTENWRMAEDTREPAHTPLHVEASQRLAVGAEHLFREEAWDSWALGF